MKKSTRDIPPHYNVDTETFVTELGTYFEQKHCEDLC